MVHMTDRTEPMLPTGDSQAAACLAPAGYATLDSMAAAQDRTAAIRSIAGYQTRCVAYPVLIAECGKPQQSIN